MSAPAQKPMRIASQKFFRLSGGIEAVELAQKDLFLRRYREEKNG